MIFVLFCCWTREPKQQMHSDAYCSRTCSSEINFYKHVTKIMRIFRQFNAACPPIGVLPGFLQALQLPPTVQIPGSWLIGLIWVNWLWIVTMWMCVVVNPYISALVTRVCPASPLIAARTGSSPQMTLYRIGGDKKWMDGCTAINTLKWEEPL